VKFKISARRLVWFVRAACVSSLAALALIVWSLLDPSPLAVIAAMSAGQALGTASLGLFVVAILVDLRRAHVLDSAGEAALARAAGEIPPPSLPSGAPAPAPSEGKGPSEGDQGRRG
jgi:hypothetical protein